MRSSGLSVRLSNCDSTCASFKAACSKAALASGCYVVAPVMPLLNKKFPKNYVDLIDGVSIPVIFVPAGKTMSISDFCSKQAELKFIVPI